MKTLFPRLITCLAIGLVSTGCMNRVESDKSPEPVVSEAKTNGQPEILPVEAKWASAFTAANQKTLNSLEQLKADVTIEVVRVDLSVGEDSPPITDSDLALVSQMHTLRELILTNAAITDEGLKHLSGLVRLEVLNLDGTAVTDAGMEHLSGLENLRRISLRGNRNISPAGEAILKKFRPNLLITN